MERYQKIQTLPEYEPKKHVSTEKRLRTRTFLGTSITCLSLFAGFLLLASIGLVPEYRLESERETAEWRESEREEPVFVGPCVLILGRIPLCGDGDEPAGSSPVKLLEAKIRKLSLYLLLKQATKQ